MRKMLLAVLLFVLAAPAFAAARTVIIVDDVIKMSKAGVGDDEIIAFVQKSREPFDVTSDDVIAMTDAHVSRAVMKAVIDESASRMRSSRRDDYGRNRTVYVSPYYDPFYYDPFWYSPYGYGYGPRLSIGFGFYGGGFRHGRHFRRW